MVQKRWLYRSVTATLLALLLAGLPGILGRTPARAKQAPARYTIESIGVLDGGTISQALALNAEGTVVGNSLDEQVYLRAVVYHAGELRELGGIEGMSTARAINSDGQIVGEGIGATGSAAMLWDGDATTTLPTLGGDAGRALGISSAGVIVGGSNPAAGQPIQACLWENGTATALPSPAQGGASLAIGINDRGQIVGGASVDPGIVNPERQTHAMLWDGAEVTDLGTLGGEVSEAQAINDNGQVVGHSTISVLAFWKGMGTHAFLWEEGTITDLGTLPGGGFSLAYDINEDGLVVGSSENPELTVASNDDYVAVLWEDGEIANLNDRLPEGSGWVLTGAQAINDAGQIVGTGHLDGEARGFVMTPEPAQGARGGRCPSACALLSGRAPAVLDPIRPGGNE